MEAPVLGDVTESLPALIARRMNDLGARSVRDLYLRLPTDETDRISYETVRKLVNGEQRRVKGNRVLRDLALMLEVNENEVRVALGVPPTYGPWEIPPRVNGLDPTERDVVMGVIDALLRAKRTGGLDAGQAEAQKSNDSGAVTPMETAGQRRKRQMLEQAQPVERAARDESKD